jgi:hypothetical protein
MIKHEVYSFSNTMKLIILDYCFSELLLYFRQGRAFLVLNLSLLSRGESSRGQVQGPGSSSGTMYLTPGTSPAFQVQRAHGVKVGLFLDQAEEKDPHYSFLKLHLTKGKWQVGRIFN